MRNEVEVSSGGVIYRKTESGVEVCLISPAGGYTWQLPKGLIEEGEAVEAAAQREVREETGLTGRVVQELERITYWYVRPGDGERARVHKFVHLFLIEYLSGSPSDHDAEVREARWTPISEAGRLLSFPNERAVLGKAAGVLRGEG